ncbi:MAG: hypothetical protein ACXVHB_14780 [Solirubrobacteraceae bacterium]
MTGLVIEHIEMPVTSLQTYNQSMNELRMCLAGAGPGVSADRLEVDVDDELSRLATELEGMLRGASRARAFGAYERSAPTSDRCSRGPRRTATRCFQTRSALGMW